MRNLRFVLCPAIYCAAIAFGFDQQSFGVTYPGVGIYDEGLTILSPNTTPNQVDTNAAGGAGAGFNATVAQFANSVYGAFIEDQGAVCTFENISLTTEGSFDVTYGVSQLQSLTVFLTTLTFESPKFHFQTGDDGGAIPISGSHYLETSAGGADFGLMFSQPLAVWGITALSRTGIFARTVNMTIVLDDASTFVFNSEVIDLSPGAGLNGLDDTFFGYVAPLGRAIVGVAIVGVAIDTSMQVRWDDMGFIIWPGPLPSGDFDGDGGVDGADFVVWQTNFPTATGATLAQGDADGDGDVDGADFVVWQTNFPFTPGPGASPVPEPQAALLASLAALGLVCRVRGQAHFAPRRPTSGRCPANRASPRPI